MRHAFTVAIRSLRRAPAFAIAAILTLGIGSGATIAVYTAVHSIVWKPLPYRDPSRLAGIWFSLPGMGFENAPQSLATYFTFKRYAHTIEGIGLVARTSVNLSDPGNKAAPQRVAAAQLTASAFPLFGMTPEQGRFFSDAEDAPHGDPVVVISDALWRTRFAADRHVIGQRLELDGRSRQIIGVAPPSFRFPDDGVQLWLPMALDSAAQYGGVFGFTGFVRMARGATIDGVRRELDALLPRMAERYPEIGPGMASSGFISSAHARAVVRPMQQDVVRGFGNVAMIATVAGALLFLIALANVASLLIARSEERQRELAIRTALGASRGRVAGLFFAESAILAVAGGAIGIALATLGVRELVTHAPPGIPRLDEVGVDASTVVFAFALIAIILLVAGGVPAIRSDAMHLSDRLRDGTRGGTAGHVRQRARRALVTGQVALATVLVAGVCMLIQSFEQLRGVRPGFESDHALTLWISLPTVTYPHDQDLITATSRILERVSTIPGVTSVAGASKLPLGRIGTFYTPIWSDATVTDATKLPPAAQGVAVTPSYFATMGIPFVAGSNFGDPSQQSPMQVIVDRVAARKYWNDSTGTNVVGHRVRYSKDLWFTVIGVVGAVHDTSLAAPANPLIYFPNVVNPDTNNSFATRTLGLVVRTRGDPNAALPAVRAAIADVDKALPAFAVAPMADVVAQSMITLSLVMIVLGVTAVVSLALAAVGLYGVLAYLVSLRQREIGVRLALGAMPNTVSRLVARQGLSLAVAGVVIGGVLFAAASRFLTSVIAGVGTVRPLVAVAVACFLLGVAVAASWIPARRAARVDPARALMAD